MSEQVRILGVDPGIALAGYGIIEGTPQRMRLVQYGALETGSDLTLPQRLHLLYRGLTSLIQTYHPQEIAVEELFFRRNVTNAFSVGQARGVILLSAEEQGLSYYQYTPAQVKQAVTGYGKADKAQIQQMVRVLLGLTAIPKPDDAADALAIAICHLQHSGWRGKVGAR